MTKAEYAFKRRRVVVDLDDAAGNMRAVRQSGVFVEHLELDLQLLRILQPLACQRIDAAATQGDIVDDP